MKKGSQSSSQSWGGSFFGSIPSSKRTPGQRGESTTSVDMERQDSSEMDNSIVRVADETVGEGGAEIANDKTGKIKFKRAKKLGKKVGGQYSKAMGDAKNSRFHDWTKMEMVNLLVKEGVELRNESSIERVSLKDLCEALYFERDMPPKPPLPTIFDIIQLNAAARRVQNMWVIHQCEKRAQEENERSEEYIHSMNMDEEGAFGNDLGMSEAEIAYMAAPKQTVIAGEVTEHYDETTHQMLQNAGEGGGGDAAVGAKGRGGAHRRLAPKKKGVNVLDTPWEKPDYEKAKRYADYVQPRRGGKGGSIFDFWKTTSGRHCCLGNMGEQLDLWEEGQISEFGIYGSGVTNYFKFIKWCFWLFMILAIVAIPAVVLNDSGPNNANSGLQALGRTTAGNLLSPYANISLSLSIPGCNSYGVYAVDCSLNKASLAEFYSSLDIAIVIISFVAFMWLRVFEIVEERTLEKNTVNASMFTVTLSRLPKDCTEEDIIAHFRKICPQHKIANVSMAFDNAKEIEECTNRGNLIRAKVRAVHEHRRFCTKLKEKMGEDAALEKITKEREKFYLRMANFSKELKVKEDLLAKYAESPSRPIFAFVTFDRAAGREATLEAFNGHPWIYNYFYHQELKLKGKWLRVTPSPEPSTILWENLAYGRWDCYRRRAITSVIALLMILISLAMIFSAKYLEQVNSNENSADLCPTDFNSYTEAEKEAYVEDNPDQLSCYCDQLSTIEQSQDHLCQTYLRKNIQSQILQYFASVSVLFVNIAIEKVLKKLSAFEKHNNEDERGLSTFLRLFILKYINTTLVFFINNNNVVLEKIFGVKTPSTTEFTADWFNTIGVTVILVQLGDIFSCHGDKVMKWLKHMRRRRAAAADDTALTQDDLNQAQVGPEFEFAFSYAQLLSTIFCCFTFSTGIPILYVIAMANFFIYYFVEKYLFIYLYRVPPHFGNNVGKRATAMLPYAFVVHLAMSIWVLSNKELFRNEQKSSSGITVDSGNSSFQDKITGKATWPLFLFLVIIVSIRICTHVYKASSKTINALLEKTCGTRCTTNASEKKKKAASAMAVVTYTRAVQRNLIKGLATYNILQNPIYKESFAITWKFAMANKYVSNVRNNKAKAQVTDDETDADKVGQLQRNYNPRDTMTKKQSSNRGFYAAATEDEDAGRPYQDNGGSGGGDGGGGAVEMTAPASGYSMRPPSTSSNSSNGRPVSGYPAGRVVSPRAVYSTATPRSPAVTPRYQNTQGGVVNMGDPAVVEEQRRLYAQYQANASGGTPNRNSKGNGSRPPSYSYSAASTTNRYSSSTTSSASYSSVPVGQQMQRPGSTTHSPRYANVPQPAPVGDQRMSHGGYSQVLGGLGSSARTDSDGFENADHLLYD